MPRKTWAAGDVLTATDLMNYLMDQVVVVCTSSTRPSSPEEGMHIYETDTDHLLRWTGAAWSGVQSSELRATGAGGGPRLYLRISDGPSNENAWDVAPASDGTLRFRTLNDAENVADAWMTVDRAGETPSSVTFSERVIVSGGVDVAGSPTGYTGGEVRFNDTTVDAGIGLSTLATGSPIMFFDHRAASNAGLWKWRNGSGAGSERMTLTGTGELHTASGVVTGGNVESGASVLAVQNGSNHTAFQDNDNHTWEGDGSGGWRFANRLGTTAALFTFVGGDDTLELLRITDPGAVDNTALWMYWKSHDGTLRFKQVRATQAGDIDGTTRRYLYVVES